MQTIPWDAAERAAVPVGEQRPTGRLVAVATAGTLLAFLAGGLLSALLWGWFADPPYSVVDGDNAYQDAAQLSRQFGIDVAFAYACLVVAVPLGALVGLLWHRVGWPLSFTLVVAACLAAALAWQLGGAWGPEEPRALLAAAQDGDRLYQPLTVQAQGLLLAYPVGALIGFIAAVAAVDRMSRGRTSRTASPEDAKTVIDEPGRR